MGFDFIDKCYQTKYNQFFLLLQFNKWDRKVYGHVKF